MDHSKHTIGELAPHEVAQAVETLCSAFVHEVHFRQLFRRGHEDAVRAVMAMTVAEGMRNGRVEVTRDAAGAVTGVAVWHPPGVWPPGTLDVVASLPHLLRVARHAGPGGLGRLMRFGMRVSAQHVARPHWYLSALGAAQSGAGIGGALMRHRLAHADREGQAAYLETQEQASVEFYRRCGFTLQGDPLEFDGFTSWQMLRLPRAK